ncbi:MAG: cytochrome P450, partial [Geminicoccaceae bacterium]
MTEAPRFPIDMTAFRRDPYPILETMRRRAPIAHVPELGGVMLTRRDDIMNAERHVDVFSSHQPNGLMNRLMGLNLMRKDGEAHRAERRVIYPALSPKAVGTCWQASFEGFAERLLDQLSPKRQADLVADYALPLSAEALKAITGLTNIRYQDMDAWSQAMIDGIANYGGDPKIEARCHAATARIDQAIDERLPVVRKNPDRSLLSVMHDAGMPMDSLRANIKLAISGGQNEPRDAIAGAIWALLNHPDQLALV